LQFLTYHLLLLNLTGKNIWSIA